MRCGLGWQKIIHRFFYKFHSYKNSNKINQSDYIIIVIVGLPTEKKKNLWNFRLFRLITGVIAVENVCDFSITKYYSPVSFLVEIFQLFDLVTLLAADQVYLLTISFFEGMGFKTICLCIKKNS